MFNKSIITNSQLVKKLFRKYSNTNKNSSHCKRDKHNFVAGYNIHHIVKIQRKIYPDHYPDPIVIVVDDSNGNITEISKEIDPYEYNQLDSFLTFQENQSIYTNTVNE